MNSNRFYAIGVAALILTLAPCASGQEYTFGQWASDTGLSPEATSVNASSQGITSLEGLSDFSSLTSVELSDNDISSIESGDFVGMAELTYLGLSLNQITSVGPSYWSDLGNLTELHLAECPIATLPENGFLGLGSLEKLHLEYLPPNTPVEAGAFAGLANLTELDLSSSIVDVGPGSFSGLDSLLNLSVGGWMTTDDLASFDLIDSLTSLTLGGVSGVLEPGDLSSFNHLDQLRAYSGGITRVMPGALEGFGGSFSLELESSGALGPGSLTNADDLKGLRFETWSSTAEWDMTGADFADLAYFCIDDWGSGKPACLTLMDATLSQSAFDAIMEWADGSPLLSLDLSFSDLSGVDSFLAADPFAIHWAYGDCYFNLANVQFSGSVIDSGYADVVAMIDAASEAALNNQSWDYRDPKLHFWLTVDEALWEVIGPQVQLQQYTNVVVVETVPEPATAGLLTLCGLTLLRRRES